MHHNRRSFFRTIGCSMALGTPLASQSAETYPDHPMKFVVPNPPGGLPDTVARVFAQKLSERLGQSVVIDNRPGANGVVASQVLASAPKDGHTFLVADGSMFSVNPHLYKSLGYDYKRDFLPVSLMASAPLYLAVHPRVKASNLRELIALVKSKPAEFTYGSSGIGSTHHLSMEALKSAMGLEMTHVPFKGTGQSVPALVGGQVDMLFSALPSLAGFVKTGQVRLLANNASKRSIQEPNIPTISELVPGYDFAPTVNVFASTGVSMSLLERLSSEIAKVAKHPEVVQILGNAGVEPVGGSPSDCAKAIASESERFGKAILTSGIKSE